MAVVLLVASAGAMLLPTSITGRINNLVQVLVPFQDGVNRVANAGDRAISRDDVSPPTEDARTWQSIAESLATKNRRLRADLDAITRVRDRGLGMQGRLIPARVVADDAAYWRESKLILGGLQRGVAGRDGVISRHFSVKLADSDGVRGGMAVLAAEVLVGVIDTAGTYTSRVRLLSDPETRMPVAVGRMDGDTFLGVEAAFWLVGRGNGVIEVRDVHHQYVSDGNIAVGDTVLTRADAPRLPPSVTIGIVTEIDRDPDNALLYVLRVTPRIDLGEIRSVYVVDTDD